LPLPSPILDDRSYQQLRDELVRRIPVYAPEWTDHNASDPGITPIELFAFLGENLLYRFNQIPDATKLAFLRLLQIPLCPATAARSLVTLTSTDSSGASVLVPIGTQMMAGSLPVDSLTEVSAWPLEVTAIGKIVAPEPDSPDEKEFAQASIDARGGIKFDRTYLDLDAGVVELVWTTTTVDSTAAAPALGAGLAFDQECRLYHCVAAEGRVERLLWKATDPLGPVDAQPPPLNLIEGETSETLGDFTATDHAGPLAEPRGLTADINDRLFIAETGADQILVYDLWRERLLRKISLPGTRPTDLADTTVMWLRF
jgi:hypothetical protein